MTAKLDKKVWIKQSLPQEHGSWAFVVEPLLISAIVGGRPYAITAIGFFLAFLGYRPALIGIKDLAKRKRYPRTMPSFWIGGILLAAGWLIMAAVLNLAIMGSLIVMGSVFMLIDAKAEKRSVLREGFGSLLAVPAAVVAAPYAWPILVVRPIVSILSVRGLIARWEDSKICRWIGVGLSLCLVPLAYFLLGGLDWRFAAYSACFLRACYSALVAGRPVKAVHIGIAEMVVSVLIVSGWLLDISTVHGR